MSGNMLREFPINLLKCDELVELRLDLNDLDYVPLELATNTKLRVLTLHGNARLTVPMPYMCTKAR